MNSNRRILIRGIIIIETIIKTFFRFFLFLTNSPLQLFYTNVRPTIRRRYDALLSQSSRRACEPFALSLSFSFLLSRDDLSSFVLFPSLFLAARVSSASDRDRVFPILRLAVFLTLSMSSSFSYTQIKPSRFTQTPRHWVWLQHRRQRRRGEQFHP